MTFNSSINFKTMKKISLIIIICFLIENVFSQNPQNILFLGNSMTYFNDMPIIFDSISNSKGKNVTVQYYAPGGTGFVNHVNDNNFYNLIRNNNFDIVVLQPGTSESAGYSFPVSVTADRGNTIVDSIKKYNPCVDLYLYEISNGVASSTTYSNYFATQKVIKDSMSKLSDLMQIPLIPAGECARAYYTQNQDLLLHNSYGDVHPNLNGSYLIASAAFISIYKESVSPCNYLAGVSQTNASNFQIIADSVVLNHLQDWRLDQFNLFSNFDFQILNQDVNFTNLSSIIDSLEWNFGDGNISNIVNPTHNYSLNGLFTVTLTVFKNGCEKTLSKEINITVSNLIQFSNNPNVNISPNPFQNEININSKKKIENVKIASVDGRELFNGQYSNKIQLEELKSGVYFMTLTFNDLKKETYKIIKF